MYHSLWSHHVTLGPSGWALRSDVRGLVDDALMALFFFVVGLEIKREWVSGELRDRRAAVLPAAAAVGGMVVPALVYTAFNAGGGFGHGWGVPMATDIAFALGALAIAAPRAPLGLKIFLAALAIVDDIGAVLIIAFFYTGGIVWHDVAMGAGCLTVLVGLNLARVRALTPYLVVGLGLWFYVHEAGVHATIAGVLLAMTIPVRTRIDTVQYSSRARDLLDDFDRTETGDFRVLTSTGQQRAIFAIGHANLEVLAPLLRLEHALHGLSAFIVMPLFALSNAGIALTEVRIDRVAIGVVLGLVAGKAIGILGGAFAAVRLRIATLPEGVTWMMLTGSALFGGIGFTMSLFIAMLAFEGSPLLDSAKIAILAASACAAVLGACVMRKATRSS
jgi:NhaA family Na+:H+ antiporter